MRITILITALFCTIVCSAHDFSVKDGSNTLYYNITDTIRREVELTYKDGVSDEHKSYEGELNVKPSVTYKGRIYKVSAIGDKAFSGNRELTSVEIPMGVRRIGEFAFENCKNLRRVMLPANEAKIATGAFFGCEMISKLSIGSEWKNLDLKDFCWSKELKKLVIPARVAQIKNLLSLPYLQEVIVDENNAKFKSYDGALYNADGKVLLGCPRGRAGRLTVAAETETIYTGALSRCVNLEEIALQKNVRNFSFREFSHLRNLKLLELQMTNPVMTAVHNGQNVMAIQMENPSLVILVLKSAKKMFSDALTMESGKYSEIKANKSGENQNAVPVIEYDVNEIALAGKAQLVTVKEFQNP